MKRIPYYVTTLLGSALLLFQVSMASAEEIVTATLAPTGNSAVTGKAVISATGNRASVSLDVAGLNPGASYTAQLNVGTCAAPSASFGALGTLKADGSGKAKLTATTATFSAGGIIQDLAVAGLADGDHIVSVGGQGVVACGAIPRSARAALALPNTGESPPGTAVALLGVLGLFAVGGGLVLRRR